MMEKPLQLLQRLIRETEERTKNRPLKVLEVCEVQGMLNELKSSLDAAIKVLSMCRPDSESNWVDWDIIKKELGVKEME